MEVRNTLKTKGEHVAWIVLAEGDFDSSQGLCDKVKVDPEES